MCHIVTIRVQLSLTQGMLGLLATDGVGGAGFCRQPMARVLVVCLLGWPVLAIACVWDERRPARIAEVR